MSRQTIVTISEDHDFQMALCAGLRGAGLEALPAVPGSLAIDQVQVLMPGVVVVDDRFSASDPVDFCRQVRDVLGSRCGTVMLVSPAHEGPHAPAAQGKPNGLPPTPFDHVDIESLTRSIVALVGVPEKSASEPSVLAVHGLEMDRRRMRVAVDGREIKLTATEFRLAWTMACLPGIVFTRLQLCDACRDSETPVQARTIDVHIRTIRQKLGPRAELIETVRGVGYRILDERQVSANAG